MNEESKLSKLQKGLYSRTAPPILRKKSFAFRPETSTVPTDWEHREESTQEAKPIHYEEAGLSFFTKLFIGSLVFFLLALGAGLYLLLQGSNIVSADNVDITVSGPLSVGAGADFSFDVQVYNKNNIKLEVVDLTVDFPNGSVDPDDTTKEYKRFRQLMSDIEPGSFTQKTVRGILYGEENSKKTLMIKVEYRIKGSSALYYKEKPYEIVVTSAPVSISVESFKEIQSNQDIELTVQVTSNSKQVLRGMLVHANYPFGFTFVSSDVKSLTDNSTWKIGDIKPQEKKKIVIRGHIEGQNEEDRVFRFTTGLQSAKNDKVIGTEFVSGEQSVKIKKPFLTTTLVLDGSNDTSEFVGRYGQSIPAEIQWFNNLPNAITDAEIHAKFSGVVFDKTSVNPEQGLYRSADNEVVWNVQTTKDLKSIGAGESGRVTFRFVPKDTGSQQFPITNPTMKVEVSVKARRVSEQNVPENINSSAVRTVKIASSAAVSAQVVRSTGPFENTGPIPPKVEQITTYTVIWTVSNTSSSISGAEVRTTLPPYIKWTGKVSPSTEDIKYNSVDGSLVWNIGDVASYTGYNNKRREVAFQIALEPSINQVGQTLLPLVNEMAFKAVDVFTGTGISAIRSVLTTRFSTDPNFKNGDEIITR